LKNKIVVALGKKLMSLGKYKICIVDDEKAYFTKPMVQAAKKAGFSVIDRYYSVDKKLLTKFQNNHYDLIILDVRGSTEEDIAKDGIELAVMLKRTTPCCIAITSAHQFYLRNKMKDIDYVIENRTLTVTDFIDTINDVVTYSLDKHYTFYKKIIFRVGFTLAKQNI